MHTKIESSYIVNSLVYLISSVTVHCGALYQARWLSIWLKGQLAIYTAQG